MNGNLLYKNPLKFYESLLLGPLTQIYTARKKTNITDWMIFSNLLFDKFAIHSMSFFHLSSGIVEHKKSGEKQKMKGYDLFTVNITFRALIETYTTFNNIFVEPKTKDETKFRYLLWKLDGLYQKKKYNIDINDFENASNVIQNDLKLIKKTIDEIEQTEFKNNISSKELYKVYKPDKSKADWKFILKENRIYSLRIAELVKHVCKIRAFTNMYNYTSLHSHSNFPAIAEFEATRGKPITDQYTDSITRLAIYLTCLLIYDVCEIDKNAKIKLNSFPKELKDFINGISISIKNSK